MANILHRTLGRLLFVMGACLSCSAPDMSEPLSVLPDIKVTGQGLTMATYNASIIQEEDAVLCETSSYTGGFSFAGEWNLSEYNRVGFTIINKDDESMLEMALHIQDIAKPIEKSGPKGTMIKTFTVEPGEMREFVFDLPQPLPESQLLNQFKLMFNSPYALGYGMVECEVDWTAVTRVKFFAKKGKLSHSFIISNLRFLPGRKSYPKTDQWMGMNEDEFFPFIDKYGQFKHKDWKGKIHTDEELHKAKEIEEQDLAANPGPADRSKYGGWKNGPRYEATGHFRVQKIDGKWWFIDPEGYLWWSHGVVRVTPSSAVTPLDDREYYFEYLPSTEDEFSKFYYTYDELLKPYYTARNIKKTYDFSSANLYRKYGDNYKDVFADLAHRRLASWGLNTIANSSDKDICHMSKTPYIERIEINQSPVLHGTSGIWWKFRDPFDPEFANEVRRKLTEAKPQLDDPWCVGYFVDNELNWGDDKYLARCSVNAPARDAVKQAMTDCFHKKYGSIQNLNDAWKTEFADWNAFKANRDDISDVPDADLIEFNEQIARKYFSTIRDIFKEIAPDKLYMGCRFAGVNDLVLRVALDYCDLLSWNSYRMDLTTFMEAYTFVDKPIVIGEFHFGALDRGKFHPSQTQVNDQEQRGRAYYNYVKSALEHPLVVGTHWHQFSDQATTGRFDGENFQVGLTDMCDTPYWETVEKIREIGYIMYDVRFSASKPGHEGFFE